MFLIHAYSYLKNVCLPDQSHVVQSTRKKERKVRCRVFMVKFLMLKEMNT